MSRVIPSRKLRLAALALIRLLILSIGALRASPPPEEVWSTLKVGKGVLVAKVKIDGAEYFLFFKAVWKRFHICLGIAVIGRSIYHFYGIAKLIKTKIGIGMIVGDHVGFINTGKWLVQGVLEKAR